MIYIYIYSGKSSLVSLLFGLFTPVSGSITIDEIDITSIPRADLRSGLIGLPQEPLFVPGTVRRNLTLAQEDASDESMIDVLKKVDLWDKINASSEGEGLDSTLEAEELFSHGERQLFCLSRAMLDSGRILVLDEATSR